MERNYKQNKNPKLENLFLCQKQIQQLKSKLLTLIQTPCPNVKHLKKLPITIEVNSKPKRISRSNKTRNKTQINRYSPSKLTNKSLQAEFKKNLCPCNSYQIQQVTKRKKISMSQSPKKIKKSKGKIPKTISHEVSTYHKNFKPLKTESTAQNNNDSVSRSSKQTLKKQKINPIKNTISVNYSFEESLPSCTHKSKGQRNQIRIEHGNSLIEDFSEVKKFSIAEERQSFVSPLNSKYFRAYQDPKNINSERSIQKNEQSSWMNHEAQEALDLDQLSGASQMKLKQSQHEFMSIGMTAVKKLVSPIKRDQLQRQPMTSINKKKPLETDLTLDLIKDICQKTQRFVTEQINPFREVLCKKERTARDNSKKLADTKLASKISNFKLWINHQSDTDST